MKKGVSLIAINFETATGKRASVCEAGICVVKDGTMQETKSRPARPKDNLYSYWNMQCRGIQPEDTKNASDFPQVWEEIERLYPDEFDTFVAHDAGFNRSCLEHSSELYHLHLPELEWECSLRTAHHIYDFDYNSLEYFCKQLDIPEGTHHHAGDDAEMCARLYLREVADTAQCELMEQPTSK